jgi:DNA repair photolyase
MIVSASYRTDIPAFYGDWFRGRLAEGFALVANPYGGADYRVALDRESTEGFVFWSRNPAPFRPVLEILLAEHRPFALQFTITGYPRPLEAAVPASETAVALLRDLAERYGGRAIVWRYDPILISDLTDEAWHEANFGRLAQALVGSVDEVVLSFAQIYAKTARNLATAAKRHGFAWRDPPDDEKRNLIQRLSSLAAEAGMQATICAQPHLVAGHARPAVCIDSARLSDVAGRSIRARTKGNRAACACHESRDIGAYDSCPQGCAYCYAVRDPAKAKARLKVHDRAAARL